MKSYLVQALLLGVLASLTGLPQADEAKKENKRAVPAKAVGFGSGTGLGPGGEFGSHIGAGGNRNPALGGDGSRSFGGGFSQEQAPDSGQLSTNPSTGGPIIANPYPSTNPYPTPAPNPYPTPTPNPYPTPAPTPYPNPISGPMPDPFPTPNPAPTPTPTPIFNPGAP